MNKPFRFIISSVICLITISSCKKAGTDGDATIVIFAQHHGRSIPNHNGYPDSVYVKFNTQELPSDPTHNYDMVFVGEPGEDHIHCTTLHTGKYFMYVTGWDTVMNMRVMGGVALRINYKERKQEIDQNIPVTE